MSTPERPTAATARRQYAVVVLVAAAACGVLLLAVGRPWLDTTVVTAQMPRREITVTGAEAMPWLRGAALVALAGVATWLVSSGVLRRVLGVVVLLAGATVGVAAATAGQVLRDALVAAADATAAGADSDAVATAVDQAVSGPWRWVALAAAAGLALSGLAVALLGGAWPGWSRRYDAPGSSQAPAAADSGTLPRTGATAEAADDPNADPAGRTDAQDLWRELDAGRDPTR